MELCQPPFAQPGPEYRITSELFSISYKGCERAWIERHFSSLALGTATKGSVPVLEQPQRMRRKTGSNNFQRVLEVVVANATNLEGGRVVQSNIDYKTTQALGIKEKALQSW